MKSEDMQKSFLLKTVVVSSLIVGFILAITWGSVHASIFVVSNTNNSGTGSLRLAINNANITAGKDTIKFNIPGASPHIIRPASFLPFLTDSVVIDGTTQPDYAGTPTIVIDGVFTGSGDINGFVLTGGNSAIRGVTIIRFPDTGIEIRSTGNIIEGNLVGIDSSGVRLGNGGDGIAIFGSNNTIGGTTVAARNIISANGGRGILIQTIPQSSGLVTNNFIQGNYIGTNITGTISLGNQSAGVVIFNAADNTVGGDSTGTGNIISGSVQSNGVFIGSSDGTTSGNIVRGNLIGTDVTGKIGLGNGLNGILIQDAFDNKIGGTEAGAGNIISGNTRGIGIANSLSTGNLVQGNFVGTDSTGTSLLGNSLNGIFIRDASGNTIGGADSAARNIISGNGFGGIDKDRHGVRISLLTPGVADSNVIEGNYIGTDVTGDAVLDDKGNAGAGIFLEGAANTIIKDNLISGNVDGIVLNGTMFPNQATEANIITGNFIGINASGSAPIPNRFNGISLLQASNNTIGGTNVEDRNVISANLLNGIRISSEGDSSLNNAILGNYIGLNASGTAILANLSVGVFTVDAGASGTIIGGTEIGAGNVIAGQDINISLSSDDNRIQGNFIGTDALGNTITGNDRIGVWLLNSSNNEIGGFEVGAGNLIANHSDSGIILFGTSSENLIARNTLKLNELNGVRIGETGTGNAIRENSIHSNNFLGIDLDTDGVTPNDQNDLDTGPNNFQNHPLLISGTASNSITLNANLHSLADTEFIVEFFANSECDPSGYGEGQTFIGADVIVTDSNGDAFFTSHFPNVQLENEYLTATATDTDGNTSEFCPCLQVELVSAPPAAPNLVAPADEATNIPRTEPFAWTKPSGANGYHLQIAADIDFTSIVFDDSTLTDTVHTTAAQSLESSTKYYWHIRARNVIGWGNYSLVRSFETGAPPAVAPFPVKPADGTIDLPTAVTFVWTSLQSADTYHLRISTDANFTTLVFDDSTLETTTTEVQALAAGTKHYWHVRARNSFGGGPYSETRSFEIGAFPTAPALIEPADQAEDLPTAVTFTWASSQGAETYHLQLSTDANFTALIINDSTLTDTTRGVQSLAKGAKHYWRVRAHNGFGWGNYSEVRSFEVGAPPAAPALIDPADQAVNLPTTITFTWASSQGAETYHLQLSTDANFAALVSDDSTLTDTTQEVQSLAEGTKHYWRVRAANSFGWGPYSETHTFEVKKTTSVGEAGEQIPKEFSLAQNYPNPFNPETTINYELPLDSRVTIKIYNILGHEIKTLVDLNKPAGRYSLIWDATNNFGQTVSSGVYFYIIRAESKQNGTFNATKKMIILK